MEYNATSVQAPTGGPEPPEIGTPCEADSCLIGSVKASGWAVPVARRVEDLDPETLAGVAGLSRRGVAHLFAEGGGLVLAMPGSTVMARFSDGFFNGLVGSLTSLPVRPGA